jgi:hypothetical protein
VRFEFNIAPCQEAEVINPAQEPTQSTNALVKQKINPFVPAGQLCFRITRLAVMLLLTTIAGSSSGLLGQHIDAPGLVPRQAFNRGPIEDINLYNLNLVVTLPITQRYPVTHRFSYGLTAYYNGALQWSTDGTTSGFGLSSRNPAVHGWLGAGWRLDFGKVVNHITESGGSCTFASSDWVSPGGAVHPFNQNVSFGATEDGSDVRIQNLTSLSSNCQIPISVKSNPRFLNMEIDPNTGQVTALDYTVLHAECIKSCSEQTLE